MEVLFGKKGLRLLKAKSTIIMKTHENIQSGIN